MMNSLNISKAPPTNLPIKSPNSATNSRKCSFHKSLKKPSIFDTYGPKKFSQRLFHSSFNFPNVSCKFETMLVPQPLHQSKTVLNASVIICDINFNPGSTTSAHKLSKISFVNKSNSVNISTALSKKSVKTGNPSVINF